MAKRKKKQRKNQKQQPRHVSQTRSTIPTSHQLSEVSEEVSDRLRIEAEERYHQKQIRREVSKKFDKICTQTSESDLEEIVAFLSDYFSQVDLVREALQPYKYSQNPWCIETWRILDSEDPEATARGYWRSGRKLYMPRSNSFCSVCLILS